ncbi:MAG: HAMP domain-containing protein [Planctomycetaceae bacterium]|nr:HAMP domain-containing protein [Planctomycetaceae bacterium]
MYLNIRGKMALGLILVLLVSLILFIGSVVGLFSYRGTVQKFDQAMNDSPRQEELVNALAQLALPLMQDYPPFKYVNDKPVPPTDSELNRFSEAQYGAFIREHARAEEFMLEFRTRINHLRDRDVRSRITQILEDPVSDIERGLEFLEMRADYIVSPDRIERLEVLDEMRRAVATMASRAVDIPPVTQELNREIYDARQVHKTLSLVVYISGAASLIIFLLLIRYGYVSFFVPVHKLYEGARRVANEDFSYRVQINSEDEMGEFAAAFNSMIDRFQDIKNDLDQQVMVRSKQLVRSERLAGVGFLAAGVAHEINNPLSAIVMAAESLEERIGPLESHLDKGDYEVFANYLKMIQREAERCRSITGRLLDFARGQEGVRQRVDVTSTIREVLEMISHLGKFKGRNIIFDYPHPCYLVANGAEIKQVMLNLTANALEAMSDGGTLTITIRELSEQVEIAFRDDGAGMTQEVQDNLFEPFYTSKQAGQGTGLGLSISNRIIDDHQGTIEAKSDGPGTGSTFLVKLPRKATQQSAA